MRFVDLFGLREFSSRQAGRQSLPSDDRNGVLKTVIVFNGVRADRERWCNGTFVPNARGEHIRLFPSFIRVDIPCEHSCFVSTCAFRSEP